MITSVPAIRPAVDVLPVTIHVITNVSAVPVIRQVTAFASERARDVLICLTLYANFAVATRPLKLVLIENPGADDSINHLGVEVESVHEVLVEHDRVTANAAKSDKGCCAPQLSSDKKIRVL